MVPVTIYNLQCQAQALTACTRFTGTKAGRRLKIARAQHRSSADRAAARIYWKLILQGMQLDPFTEAAATRSAAAGQLSLSYPLSEGIGELEAPAACGWSPRFAFPVVLAVARPERLNREAKSFGSFPFSEDARMLGKSPPIAQTSARKQEHDVRHMSDTCIAEICCGARRRFFVCNFGLFPHVRDFLATVHVRR